MTMLPQTRLVGHARSFVERACVDASADRDMRESAVLLASEAVTNAIVHGRGHIRIEVVAGPGGVRVDIGDQSAALPIVHQPNLEAVHGRGMATLAAAATDWGVTPNGTGKTIWFQLGVPPAALRRTERAHVPNRHGQRQ